MLEAFYHKLTEFNSKLMLTKDNLGVFFPNLVVPFQLPTLPSLTFHLLYSTTASVINHRP